MLEASFGAISDDYVLGEDLINLLGKVKVNDSKRLTKAELSSLLEMVDKKERSADNPKWADHGAFGRWQIFISYNDIFYHLAYCGSLSQIADCLVEQLYELLPIQGDKWGQLPLWAQIWE
ncbi:MAG: hypothetical protein LBB91_04195 [Clostridiales bacterium]|jgi:hypothetical protein|nr:hypothetical protein [Clostridiales bacterium]